jgi:2,4-dichlorophenol 6-monooxygenase
MPEISIPVLIVGGGGCGLAASLFLSDLNISSLLVERHSTTSPQPKAHILNGRTMEIFAQHGLADEIYRESSPPEHSSAMVWLTSLGGDEPYDRKVLYRSGAYGGLELAERYAAVCASRHGNLGQRWLEPLLRAHAEARNPGGVLFSHQLESFSQDAGGVVAIVTERPSGRRLRIRARYLIAADGGRTVGPALDVAMVGVPTFMEWINMHVRADFSQLLEHDDAIVNRVCSLTDDGRLEHCGVVPMGPKRWGRFSEEWTLMFARPPGATKAADLDDEAVERLVRGTLKLPADHSLEIESISRWPVEGTVADRFVIGNVFLAGDAAHRHPPSGALGLNTGIQDVHNLAWKLATVLSGAATTRLLDGYHEERHPIATKVVERAVYSLFNQIAISAGTGVVAGAEPEWNRAQMTALFADSADGRTRQAVLGEYFNTNRITTAHLGMEMGYDYAEAGFVCRNDGAPAPEPDCLGLEYHQTTCPGHRMPHMWFMRDGSRVSTHQLLVPGAFLLIAVSRPDIDWAAITDAAATRYGVAIELAELGVDLIDPEGAWSATAGSDAAGALLVRPDGFVAARTAPTSDPESFVDRGLRDALALD